MFCETCEDEIDPRGQTFYESVVPVEGGGQVTTEYCSVACMNQDVGFTDAEIESLMRQAGYDVPPDTDENWVGLPISEIDDIETHFSSSQTNFFLYFKHMHKPYDVEIFWNSEDALYEVGLYSHEVRDGKIVGLEEVQKEFTSITQRAVAYAEEFMETVDGQD